MRSIPGSLLRSIVPIILIRGIPEWVNTASAAAFTSKFQRANLSKSYLYRIYSIVYITTEWPVKPVEPVEQDA